MEPQRPNQDQERHWNHEAGPGWVQHRGLLDAQLAPFGERLVEALDPQPGERVLDVGCGFGTTSIEVAERVGASGEVLGVDISRPLLDLARQRGAGIGQLRFHLADAQTYAYPAAHFDASCSRFGVMFFADPAHAFGNLAQALRPGGRLVFLAWQGRDSNPWLSRVMAAVGTVIELPRPPSADAPGPFSLGDGARVAGLLAAAGFPAPQIRDLQIAFRFGPDIEGVLDHLVAAGPMAKPLADAPAEQAAQARAAMRRELLGWASPAGVIAPSACWLVTARKPV